ncbi:Methyltransferase FkbM [Candidatus Nanopelagicaceae bacterium]
MSNLYQKIASFFSFVFGIPFFEKFNRFLLILSLRNLGYGFDFAGNKSGEIPSLSKGEEKYIKYIKSQNLAIVVDVGASKGNFSERFLSQESVSVFAFEPVESSFKVLKAMQGKYENLVCENFAVGNFNGAMNLWVSENNTELSTLSKEVSEFGLAKKINQSPILTQVVTLDTYFKNLRSRIDLLKIDTEGFELEVLAGAQELLRNLPPRFIQVENSRSNLLRGSSLYQIASQLKRYEVFQISPGGVNGLRKVASHAFDANIFLYSNFLFKSLEP